eukprot:8531330-Alexandrium_andersonii.AAC.1
MPGHLHLTARLSSATLWACSRAFVLGRYGRGSDTLRTMRRRSSTCGASSDSSLGSSKHTEDQTLAGT